MSKFYWPDFHLFKLYLLDKVKKWNLKFWGFYTSTDAQWNSKTYSEGISWIGLTCSFLPFFEKRQKLTVFWPQLKNGESNWAKFFTIGLRILFCISGCIKTPKILNLIFSLYIVNIIWINENLASQTCSKFESKAVFEILIKFYIF